MSSNPAGLWSDPLSCREVQYSQWCARRLQQESAWQAFLSSSPIKKAINIDCHQHRSLDELYAIKGALFEIRVAELIERSGLTADYEYQSTQHNSETIDFKLSGGNLHNAVVLLELTSLRESQLQKTKPKINERNKSVTMFDSLLDGSDEVSEYFKAQKVLVEKSLKFSDVAVNNQFNIILLDMRSSLLEQSDCYDYQNILYGSKKLFPGVQRHTRDGNLFPGLLSETHPGHNDEIVKHLRQSIHYVGFVVEKDYSKNELAREICWFRNPLLASSQRFDPKTLFYKP